MEQRIGIAGNQINTLLLGEIDDRKPTLVFIHGGLDCIGMWREFPRQLHQATGLACLVYDRLGHGKSDPLVSPPAGDQRELQSGDALTDLFAHFGINQAILVGHSFGGAIALLAPSPHPSRIIGVVSIVPQLLFHNETRRGLEAAVAAFNNGKLRDKLIPFHGEKTDTLFRNWSSMADKPTTPDKPYEQYLGAVQCPVLALFGQRDNYGYLPNLEFVRQHVSSDLEIFEITEAAHYPHLETPQIVIEKITEYVSGLINNRGAG